MLVLVLHKSFLAAKVFVSNSNPPSPFSSCSSMEAEAPKSKPKPRPGRVAAKRSAPPPAPNACTREKADPATCGIRDMEDFFLEEARDIRTSLLRWYDENHRVLPWRTASSRKLQKGGGGGDVDEDKERAYAVWVSEVMLQQTQVQTVIGYYNRWMEKWPTVEHLADASQEEVNEMWAGLGYYRRARFLLEGAKSIVKREFPRTASELRKVRGIGDYTAGAIASIAFNEPVPVVDGNVVRVISRLKAISSNPKEAATIKKMWRLATQLVDPFRPGDFNQALMELGATLCSSTSPSCSICPVSSQCLAFSLSKNDGSVKVTDYPTKVAKIKRRHDFAAVCVLQIIERLDEAALEGSSNKEVFLLIKRPEEGLLAGLWEFPSVLMDEKETDVDTRRKAIDKYLNLFDIDLRRKFHVVLREDVGNYVHIFSHIRLHMHVELMILAAEGGLSQFMTDDNESAIIWKFVDGKSIKTIGLTSGVRKVYNMVQDFKQKKLADDSKVASRKRYRGSKQ